MESQSVSQGPKKLPPFRGTPKLLGKDVPPGFVAHNITLTIQQLSGLIRQAKKEKKQKVQLRILVPKTEAIAFDASTSKTD